MLLSGGDVRGSTRLFHHVMGSLQRIWSRKLSMNRLLFGGDLFWEELPG